MIGRALRGAALLASSILVAGCGGERVFAAGEFVEVINAEGAAIALGEVITTNPDGVEVRAVSLTESTISPTGSEADTRGSGAILVLADSDAAEAEMDRCQGAPAFACFRAANVVLRFEGIFPEEQARITSAIQAIASD